MATQGSFIPKRNTDAAPKKRSKKRVYLLGIVSYATFMGVVLVIAGMFAAKQYYKGQLAEQQQLLNEAENMFEEDKLSAVQHLHDRLELARQLLDRHVAVSRLITAIEPTVTQNTVLNRFEFRRDESDGMALTISGMTDSLGEFMIQRDSFLSKEVFRDAVFSDITFKGNEPQAEESTQQSSADSERENTKQVSFSTTFTVPLTSIQYDPSVVSVRNSGFLNLNATINDETDDEFIQNGSEETNE